MEIIATHLRVPEGPAVAPEGILFTEQTAGRVSILTSGGVREYAYVGGAANSCALAADGAVYVCQNGGVVGSWRSDDPRTPSIQRITDSGVETVADSVNGRALVAPNDLVFGPDGALHFTDPSQPFDPVDPAPLGAVYTIWGDQARAIEVGGVYCNGIALDRERRVIWVESYTRRVMRHDPATDRIEVLNTLPKGHVPDGLAVAEDGRLFIASCGSHGISVVGPDGEYLGLIELDVQANPTNCCFLDDALIVTDFGMEFETDPTAGRLWRVPVDARGLNLGRIGS